MQCRNVKLSAIVVEYTIQESKVQVGFLINFVQFDLATGVLEEVYKNWGQII